VSVQALGGTSEGLAFQDGLAALGYLPGQTIQLDFRWGTPELLGPDLAELAANSDVIVAVQNSIIRAVKQATSTVPIVMVASGDPVRAGLVASLARPGGNVTGLTPLVAELAGKRLELLKDLIPGLARVGLLWDREDADAATDLGEVQAAAQNLGLQLVPLEVSSVNLQARLQAVGELASAGGLEALLVGFDPTPRTERVILHLAAERRLPIMHSGRNPVAAGSLMAYGPSSPELFRRAAAYVDRILRGAKPADLPVEQPTKFELAINLKTARTLGLTVPPAILQQATELIQ
jgi:putative ABC transport system substrate-binding protein